MLLKSFCFSCSFSDTSILSVVQYSHSESFLFWEAPSWTQHTDVSQKCVRFVSPVLGGEKGSPFLTCRQHSAWCSLGGIDLVYGTGSLLAHGHLAVHQDLELLSLPSCFPADPQHDPWKPDSSPGLFYLSSSASHSILTNRSLNRLNTAFPKTRAHILTFALLLLPRILSPTILCLL